MKKTLCLLATLLLFSLVFSLGVAAEENAPVLTPTDSAEGALLPSGGDPADGDAAESSMENTPVEDAPVGNIPVEDAPAGNTPVEDAPLLSDTEKGASAVFSNAVGAFLEEHAEKIFCALACLASIVPTLLYKTGLLPLLRAGLSAMSDATDKAGKKTAEFSAVAEEKLATLKAGADAAVLASENALSVLREAEKRLAALEDALADSVKEKQKTSAALQTETELLFRLLQCANLPQAQKDLMTERYLAFERTLAENE
ncbi:MAG: hypothetical protein IJY71_06245 [Clostridia bacterium]|nr:hypothetical protein [Clostridia bacterium]